MSLPEELELIHFDDELLQVNKKESQKELKKQGKRTKGGHSKKNSSSSITATELSHYGTQVRNIETLVYWFTLWLISCIIVWSLH